MKASRLAFYIAFALIIVVTALPCLCGKSYSGRPINLVYLLVKR